MGGGGGGGYPIQGTNVLGLVLGTSFIKHYDRSTQLIDEIDFPDETMAILDSATPTLATWTNVNTQGYIWRALMTQDPNWQNLVDLGTSNDDTLAGAGIVDRANLNMVIIHDILPDKKVDYWWLPSLFAKFGWFAWDKNTPEMPANFINYSPCYFFEPYGNHNGFTYALFGDTTAVASSYSMLDIPANTFNGYVWNQPR